MAFGVTPLVVLACALVVPSAFSGSDRIRPWPGPEIRLHVDAPHYTWSVREAVRHWNAAALDVRLRLVDSQRNADVLVREMAPNRLPPSCGGRSCGGWASFIGYRERREEIRLERVNAPTDDERTIRLVEHEIGHVLGLTHETGRCSLMNPDTGDARCPRPASRAGLGIAADDVARAARLYGRR